MPTVYFEDVEAGQVRELGSFSLTPEEIMEFGERYDPQPFHTDPEAARESFYGGLIASGWQTAACCMRLMVEGFFGDAASMGASGVEELKWYAPVRPGQEVDVRNEILETRQSGSRNDRGYLRNQTIGVDGDGDEVISMIGTNIFRRRDAE